jgi:hypothetical protein
MPLRLVYLPDPTLKFYYSVTGKEYFLISELMPWELENKSAGDKYVEILVRPKRAHFNILNTLQKKFSDVGYTQPYFKDILNRVELFEILEVPNGKTPKTGA